MNHSDDPRITAYVLGELSAADRAAFEAELAATPALQAEIEAYRDLAAHLETELQAEACPALDPARRELLLVAPPPVSASPPWRAYLFTVAGIAAAFAVVFLTWPRPESQKKSVDMKTLALEVPAPSKASELALNDVVHEDAKVKENASVGMRREAAKLRGSVGKSVEKKDMAAAPAVSESRMAKPGGSGGALERTAPAAGASPAAAPAPGGLIARSVASAPPVMPPPPPPSPMKIVGNGSLEKELQPMHGNKTKPRVNALMYDGHVEVLEQATIKANDLPAQKDGKPDDVRFRMNRSAEEAKQSVDRALSGGGPAMDNETDAAAVNEVTNDKFANDLEQRFTMAQAAPLSTFSIDVDTASYTLLRRALNEHRLPAPSSIRIEEMLNYFDYSYPEPVAPHPVSVSVDAAICPWATSHQLVRIGVKAKSLAPQERPPCNLVFLLDCSGSMSSPDKLPLLKTCFQKLVERLDERDHVSIVVYAGTSGTVAEPTQCTAAGRQKLVEAIALLQAGGSTNGASGLKNAYDLARRNLDPKSVNRVILATDGDFNVGVTSNGELVELVKKESAGKVFLTVLGVGEGNLNDNLMQEISGKGNGNHFYIDSLQQGERVLGQRLAGTVVALAKDVKIQVDFNPARVHSYRLIGYDNRRLANEDFNDDTKDAGEIGAGHTVTALYEVIPAGTADAKDTVDASRYVLPASPAGGHDELLTVKLRYQPPQGGKSTLLEVPLKATAVTKFSQASPDFTFATSVAAAGLVLRHSQFQGGASLAAVREWLTIPGVVGDQADRQEFSKLIEMAGAVKPGTTEASPANQIMQYIR